MKKLISTLVVTEGIILTTALYSKALFANIQVASLSSFLVIIGASFAYKKMVDTKVSSESYEDKVNDEVREGTLGYDRDLLDEIEDPHELYSQEPINEAPAEELSLKEIVKEEKAKIKTFSFKSIKHGARGSVSAFRIVPYIFLILGFISLKNNAVLDLRFYLPSLLIGIIIGSLVSRKIAS